MTNTQTMIQGDCLDLMMGMPDAAFDAIITDPPYSSGNSVMNSKSDPRDKYNLSQAFLHSVMIHMISVFTCFGRFTGFLLHFGSHVPVDG